VEVVCRKTIVAFESALYAIYICKVLEIHRKFYLLHIRTYILLLVCTDRSLCELEGSIPRKNTDSRKCPPNGDRQTLESV
jgi:hypothetical protein